jgi:two-component system response regulator YesN
MYRIMLVEDEPPILYAVKHLIDAGDFGFEVSSVAQNGRDALKMLANTVPDVIMTDIMMPFVDGLALIEEVRQRFPEIICVIMSGHSDFEYAVQALRTNTFDYLLKPIQMEKLHSMLQSLKRTLDKKKSAAEQVVINQAVYFEEYAGIHGTNLSTMKFLPMLICAGHFSVDTMQDRDHPGRDFWERTDLLKMLDHLPGEVRFWVLNGFSPNEKIVIVCGDELAETQMENAALELRERLMDEQVPVQIMLRKSVQHVGELAIAVKKLRATLSKTIVYGVSSLFIEEKVRPAAFVITNEFEKRCEALFNDVPIEEFKKNLFDLLNEWENKQFTQDMIEQSLKYLTGNLMRWLRNSKETTDIFFAITELVSGSANYKELFEGYIRLTDRVYESSSESGSNALSIKEIVNRLEQFLTAHFAEPISYKMFYELFGYNETYLSHVFKTHKGISPNKYVTWLRMEKAKEFMKSNPDTPLKKIASMVGYEDALYFSRMFKDMTGLRPSEFIKHEGSGKQQE